MPDPIPVILCAGVYLGAAVTVALMPLSVRAMRNVAVALLVCVPIIMVLKLGYAADWSQSRAFWASCFFGAPSALPSLPLLGASLVAEGLKDRRAAAWSMIGGIVCGGVLMTMVIGIDLSADALNSLGVAFGPVLAAGATLVGAFLGMACWWAIFGRRAGRVE